MFRNSGFGIFANAIKNNCIVRAIPAPNSSSQPRSFFDKMIAFAQSELGAKGLAYITFDFEVSAKGPIAKLMKEEELHLLKTHGNLKDGDSVFFVCESKINAEKMSGKVREKIGQELELIKNDKYEFCWIVDFQRDNDNRI